MQNVTASDILSAIHATLTAAPSLVPDTLKQVKIGLDSDHDAGFPFCRVYLVDFASQLVDTVTHQRTYTFAVEVWQEISQASREAAELNFCNAIEGVMNRLNGTWQLGIGVENSEVQSSIATVREGVASPMRVASIRLSVTNLVQNLG